MGINYPLAPSAGRGMCRWGHIFNMASAWFGGRGIASSGANLTMAAPVPAGRGRMGSVTLVAGG